MKKIISGKAYNTATADRIVGYDNNLPYSDFHNFEAAIYRTKKGAFFLYESGGAFTKMSIPVGNNGSGGSSDIRALTEKEAIDIAAEWHTDGRIDAEELEHLYQTIGIKLEIA